MTTVKLSRAQVAALRLAANGTLREAISEFPVRYFSADEPHRAISRPTIDVLYRHGFVSGGEKARWSRSIVATDAGQAYLAALDAAGGVS